MTSALATARDLALPYVFAAAARAIPGAVALGATCAGASAKASAPSEAPTDAEGAKRITSFRRFLLPDR